MEQHIVLSPHPLAVGLFRLSFSLPGSASSATLARPSHATPLSGMVSIYTYVAGWQEVKKY